MNPLGQLPSWLYVLGSVFLILGIVWVQVIRRAHSLEVQMYTGVSLDAGNSRRGLDAIFTSDKDRRRHELDWWASKTILLETASWGLLLVVYGLLVVEYSSNAYMQSWILARIDIAAYLLNFYSFLIVGTLAGIILFRQLYRKLLEPDVRKLD